MLRFVEGTMSLVVTHEIQCEKCNRIEGDDWFVLAHLPTGIRRLRNAARANGWTYDRERGDICRLCNEGWTYDLAEQRRIDRRANSMKPVKTSVEQRKDAALLLGGMALR